MRDSKLKELIAINSTLPFKPASVAKMVSSACSFQELGSEYQFETRWGYRGELKAGVLNGDLVIHAAGDFSFVIEDLKMIVEMLRFVHGIQRIQGKLIFETSAFEQATWDHFDGFDGDEGRSFHAQMTALPINHNSFAVWAASSPDGARAHIIPAESMGLQLINQLKLKPGRLNGSEIKLSYDINAKRFVLSGAIGSEDEPKAFYRALPDAYESFARLFKFNFESLGGKWEGSYETSTTPLSTKTLLVHRSRPISKLFMDINKLSTNFGSEMILLAAARKAKGAPAGLNKARAFLKDCLQSYSIKNTEMDLENASGLSRSSFIQTQALSRMLTQIKGQSFYPEYAASMSILGQDGTTRNRLKELKGRARLKTGSIRGVRSIAGYIQAMSGEELSFALFLNCDNCDLSRWQETENRVLQELIQRY